MTGDAVTEDRELAAGRTHHEEGRLDEAEAVYRRVLARAPDYPEARHLMGLVAFQRQRFDEAEASFARAVTSAPSVGKYHGNLGAVLAAQRRFSEALAHLERAVALDASKPEIFNTLGVVQRELGNADEAVATFRRAIELDRTYAEAHANLMVACLIASRRREAIESADAAVAAVPDSAPVRNVRAMILHALGRIDDAVAELDRALAIDPTYAEARTNLDRLAAERGRKDAG